MSDICWSRTFAGRNPERILFGEDRVACSYSDHQGSGDLGPHALVCLDLEGRDCWSASKTRLSLALADGRFLGVTQSRLRILDGNGRDAEGIRDGRSAIACNAVVEISSTRDRVYIRNGDELLVTDRVLHLIDRLLLPMQRSGVFVGNGVAYIENDRIMLFDRRGHADALCDIPLAMVHETMQRHEQQTGQPALVGVVFSGSAPGADVATKVVEMMTNPSSRRPFRMGERLGRFSWRLGFHERTRMLFLSNRVFPHMIVCLDLAGNARWCTYLSPGCCGDVPIELPNGRLVASSGCGGILSWLDSTGAVVGRTRPHEGIGLAIAYGGDLRALANSDCIVSGGPGVVAYDTNGERRWISNAQPSCYDYDEQHRLLVTAWWSEEDGKKFVAIRCTKNLGLDAEQRPRS